MWINRPCHRSRHYGEAGLGQKSNTERETWKMDQDDKLIEMALPREGEYQDLVSSQTQNLVPAPSSTDLVPIPRRVRKANWRLRVALLLIVILAGGGGTYYWWQRLHPPLPAGIAFGNGRLEADEINIDTKYAARISEMMVDEGDLVKAGQVLARMDTRDLQASLKRAQASVQQAQHAVDEANANVDQQNAQVVLAKQEMDRALYTVQRGVETKELLDQRKQQLDSANAALMAAKSRVIEAEHAFDAATHDVELYTVQIDDNTLVAPRDGRIQYRIANIGEVLPAGGHVFAMLDTSDVYMDIYLPTEQAGRVRYGTEARIVLDAYPHVAIPAKVSFVSSQAQFTPKPVETQSERDKLMFRIRVQIDPERLRTREEVVRSGLPGVAYVKTDHAVAWPASLQRLPP